MVMNMSNEIIGHRNKRVSAHRDAKGKKVVQKKL